jgi:hypothetical protein
MNQCIRLSKSLLAYSYTRPLDEIKQATVGIVSILGNLRSVNKLLKIKKEILNLLG